MHMASAPHMTTAPKTGVQIAAELASMGAHMVEAKFRRENPDATNAEVASRVRAWWSDRPGARDGDCVGRRRDVAD